MRNGAGGGDGGTGTAAGEGTCGGPPPAGSIWTSVPDADADIVPKG